jgi:phosphoribosylglycinamide formyltransferase 2
LPPSGSAAGSSPATRYANAPAMQMADAFEVFPMLDGQALRHAVETYPDPVILQ